MSVESTRRVMENYVNSQHQDLSGLADDVVFTNMDTGEEYRGVDGVRGMLHWIYHVAFDASAETRNIIASDGKAVFEGEFVGKHTGEFAGIPPTGRNVRVPLCVIYDLENDKIKRARVYMATGSMVQQLGAIPGGAGGHS